MIETIPKGTKVLVTTNNCGEISGTLAHNYHPLYGIDLMQAVHHIEPDRIVHVTRMLPDETDS